MAIFSHSIYIIDPNDTNYINAIARYNMWGFIYELNGKEYEESVINLPKIINVYRTGNDRLEIKVRMANSKATIGVFPHFEADEITQLMRSSIIDEQKIARNAPKMIEYHKLQDDQHEEGACMIIDEPRVDPLTMHEAFAILLEINKSKVGGAIGGAIHFPDIQKIVFQSKEMDKNYFISYGEKSSIKLMPIFTLDIDDGFIGGDKENAEFNEILKKLQEHFQTWKYNKYEGLIIPSQMANFNCITPNKAVMQSTKGIFPHPHVLLRNDILAKTYQAIDEKQIEKLPKKVKALINYFNSPNVKDADFGSLSPFQAILLVNTLSYMAPITGLAHFYEANRILIQFNGVDHILKYGKDAYVMPMTPVFIDQVKGITGSGKMTEVRRILNQFFTTWQSADFQGSMIPVSKIGFDEIFTPTITLKNINNRESLVKFRLEDCKQKYDLKTPARNIEFLKCMDHLYKTIGLDTSQHDLFEYSLFYASNMIDLDLAREFGSNLNLRFYHSVDEMSHEVAYPLATVFFGVDAQKMTHYSPQLRKLMESLQAGCRKNIDSSASIHSYNKEYGLQYCVLLHRESALKAFLNNPVLTAQFLIENEDELINNHFDAEEVRELMQELTHFKDLNDGPTNEYIDELISKVNNFYNHCLNNTGNIYSYRDYFSQTSLGMFANRHLQHVIPMEEVKENLISSNKK